ncbi:MAG: N-acetylglucosamine kinase [Chloroflexi bacterium]|nr:N-acetylglucosamine kinase [Chloroflexota bacterium]
MSNSQQRLVLGIDGGATKTVALLGDADTGVILGRSRQRGSNFYAHDSSAAFAELDRAIAQAFVNAGLARQKVTAMCAGIAGVSRPEDEQMVSSWVRNRGIADDLLIANDGWLVIAAGTSNGIGVGVICGTGSIAVGRDAQGMMRRAGGWGYLFGDEGSGHDMAIMALRAAACAADGRGPRTALLPALLAHWQLELPEDFITYLYGVSDPRPLLGDVGPVIMHVAAEQDAVALQIVQHAGNELSRAIMAVACQLELPKPLPLALAGSMIVRGAPLQHALLANLERHNVHVSTQLVEDPVVGALRLAQRIAVGERQLKGEWQAL